MLVDNAKKNVCLATLSEAKHHVLEWKKVISARHVRRDNWRNCIRLGVDDTLIIIPTCATILPDCQIPLVVCHGQLHVGGAFVGIPANLSDAAHQVLIAVVLS